MPLTPEDVSNKRFTPVRLREGYDMGEVDQFLDEVETELERLLAENKDLRSKLEAASGGAPVEAPAPATAPPVETEPEQKPETKPEPEPEQQPAATEPFVATKLEEIKVTTAAEASAAATRLLELATRNADEVLTEATAEAAETRSTAQADADRLESESRARIEQLDTEARDRAQRLDGETESRRAEMLGDIEREKARLNGEVENLRTFEREYRSRLKSYFSQQLAALDGQPTDGEHLPPSNG